MSDIAIRVENLSKAYRLGVKEERHETLVAAAASWLAAPARPILRLSPSISEDQRRLAFRFTAISSYRRGCPNDMRLTAKAQTTRGNAASNEATKI